MALRLFLVAVIFSAAVVVRAEPQERPVPPQLTTPKIAVLLNGDSGIRKGIELAVAELAGRGVRVDLRYIEAKSTPSKFSAATLSELVMSGYKFMIGASSGRDLVALRNRIRKSEMTSIFPAGSSDVNGGPTEEVFNLWPKRDTLRAPTAEWIRRSGYQRISLLVSSSSEWDTYRRVFEEAVKESGAQIVYRGVMKLSDEKLAISALERSKFFRCDLLIVAGGASDIVSMLKVRSQLDLPPAVLVSAELRSALVQGLIDSRQLKGDVSVIDLPISPQFSHAFQARFQHPVDLYAERGYDALMLLAHSIQSSDGSSQEVRQQLLSRTDRQGALGRIRFDPNGDLIDSSYRIIPANDILSVE